MVQAGSHTPFFFLDPRVCKQVICVDYFTLMRQTNLVIPKPNPVVGDGEREDVIYKRLAFGMILRSAKNLER